VHRIGSVSPMAGQISMGARREVVLAVAERYRLARRAEKGRILDELCKVTGWHRKHAVRALGGRSTIILDGPRHRKPTYGSIIKDAIVALWEASDRVCGKRLKVMIPTLLPALERHGRLELSQADRVLVLEVSATTIDRQLVDTKIAAAGGKRRRVGFYSAIRREVPIRTFNDWNDPAPGFCEVDMVAHGGTSVAGAFIQTLTMVDVATGWTECMPLVTRESGLVVQAMERAQSLFPWLVLGADFDNDSAVMNDVVVPWCREQKIEVTRSRAYKKNDQAFVEQKNGAVVRRLVGYGRFEGIDTARVLVRLYAASRLHTNFFQPSFTEGQAAGRREGDQTLSCSGHALCSGVGASEAERGGQAASARTLSHTRSGRAAGRDEGCPDGVGRARRSQSWQDRCGTVHTTTSAGCGSIRKGARQGGAGR
jgi:hypothetical protein